jgi:hypothetical protein
MVEKKGLAGSALIYPCHLLMAISWQQYFGKDLFLPRTDAII